MLCSREISGFVPETSNNAQSMASHQHVHPPVATDLLSSEPGIHLYSSSHSYVMQSVLGEGVYGKVIQCIRKDTNKTVVVKMIKNEVSVEVAKEEVAILERLRALAPNAATLVQLNHSFLDRGHLCLEFDLLDISLLDFIQQRHCSPLSLTEMRPIIHQLATGLQYLKTFGIIHADLKLDNIMMVDHRLQPHRVKIIDFGVAHDVSAATPGLCIQTLQYRSPEVMLGLSYTEAIDMWSLGCVAAFLLHSFFLFLGKCEYEMMRCIVEVQGQPPDHLLKCARKTRKFFRRSASQRWRLKTPEEFFAATGFQPEKKRLWRINSLDDLFKSAADTLANMNDQRMFVDLMKGMLQLDATRRLTPRQVMQHPFFHQRSDNFKAAPSHRPVLHHPTRPTWQSFPPIHHQLTPHPSNNSHTQSQVRSEMNRSRVEDDVQRWKKRKGLDLDQYGQNRHFSSRAHPWKKQTSQLIHPVRKSSSTQPVHQHINPQASNTTQTQSQDRGDLKSETVEDEVNISNCRPENIKKRVGFDSDEAGHRQHLFSRAHPVQRNTSQWIPPARKSSTTQPAHLDVNPQASNWASENERKRLFKEDEQRKIDAGQLNSTRAAPTSGPHTKGTTGKSEPGSAAVKQRVLGHLKTVLSCKKRTAALSQPQVSRQVIPSAL